VVPSADPLVVQEVQETAYHVLWELVHTFFEHPGLLHEACVTCGDVAVEVQVVSVSADGATAVVERDGGREEVAVELLDAVAPGDTLLCHAGVALERLDAAPDPTAFLYPFLGAQEDDLDAVLAGVRASTVRKGQETVLLRAALDLAEVERCAAAVAARLRGGGRLVAFGNGGSSTDAQDAAGTSAPSAGRPSRSTTTWRRSRPWPTTSASTRPSPASSSPSAGRRTSRSASRRAARPRTSSRASRRPTAGGC
jgi:hydrogenase maturation factor